MKEKMKKFWEKNKHSIMFGMFCASIYAAYYLGGKAGEKFMMQKIGLGFDRIADVTPELTFGEYKKMILEETFDSSVYK